MLTTQEKVQYTLLASVLGVVLFVLVVFVLSFVFMKTAHAHDPLAELNTLVTDLRQDITTNSQTSQARDTELQSALDALQADLTTLQADLTTLQTDLTALKNTPTTPGGTTPIFQTQMQDRLTTLQTEIDQINQTLTQMTFLQEQITHNNTRLNNILTGGATRVVERMTAIPPIRLDGLSNGMLVENSLTMQQVNIIDVTFTIERFRRNADNTFDNMVLISRDETGQNKPGHFSLYIGKDRRLRLRSQGGSGNPELQLEGQQQLEAGTPHRAMVIIGPTRTVMFLDGLEIANSPTVYPLSGNELPLIIGATCWHLSEADCRAKPAERKAKMEGPVSADLFAARSVVIIQ